MIWLGKQDYSLSEENVTTRRNYIFYDVNSHLVSAKQNDLVLYTLL